MDLAFIFLNSIFVSNKLIVQKKIENGFHRVPKVAPQVTKCFVLYFLLTLGQDYLEKDCFVLVK